MNPAETTVDENRVRKVLFNEVTFAISIVVELRS